MASRSITKKIRLFVLRIFVVILLIIILFSSSKWENKSLVGNVLFFVGCILAGTASMGRLWCSLYIAGYKKYTLVTTGPYSISRNPLYFFSLVGVAGVGLTTETLLIPSIVLIVFATYYRFVIRSEERKLLNRHGESFESYRRNTPIFFPKLSLLQEPETYTVNPKIFRKSIYSTLWFIWFIGIFEIIKACHGTGLLPVYFKIY